MRYTRAYIILYKYNTTYSSNVYVYNVYVYIYNM